ncbi:hypothetical protein [Erythrobacter sp. HL-111]|uniref:hypothetical protein n=1 Tax=Erythrobacter sp. HL-111 TaxID=1798193 RepID=UPI0006DA815D|nr:hypothetical protein [Erythrobacter sp. HL-111]KPP96336.1 MAG: hypothetical protein HLUCCO15_01740 [Erythrobacteraceae bacterium HL-111]
MLNMEDGRTVKLQDHSFNASVRQDEIFVWCASKDFSAEIASTFGRFCVQIDPKVIVDRLRMRANASSSLDYSKIVADDVVYRSIQQVPLADWALPEKVALIKPESFANQREYRIAVSKRGAFDVENVELQLVPLAHLEPITLVSSKILVALGNLEDHATLHEF